MERGFFRAGNTAFDSGSASVPVAPFGVPPNGSETRADAQICASDVRPAKDAGCQFPLPAGEGQGEGERDAADQNGRTNFASSPRPAPRVRVDDNMEPKACRARKGAQSQGRPVPDCRTIETNSPHPGPLPRGEGESTAAAWRIGRARSCGCLGLEPRRARRIKPR